jgi:hypothetical protein
MSEHCGGVSPLRNARRWHTELGAINVGALIILGTVALSDWKSRMIVMNLDWLTPYQGATQDKGPWGGSSRSGWRVNTTNNEPRGGRWDQAQTSQAQPSDKKKWWYACRLFRTNSLTEAAVWCIDPLLGKDFKTNEYSHCYGGTR